MITSRERPWDLCLHEDSTRALLRGKCLVAVTQLRDLNTTAAWLLGISCRILQLLSLPGAGISLAVCGARPRWVPSDKTVGLQGEGLRPPGFPRRTSLLLLGKYLLRVWLELRELVRHKQSLSAG